MMHNNEILLSVENLKTYFKTSEGIARAVDGVSFQIKHGETFALVGESGCGKSVTGLSIIRLIAQPPGFIAGGSVIYKDRDILRMQENEVRRLRGEEISMIFQEPMTSLNPVFTVGHQILEVLRLHQGLSGRESKKKAIEMLDLVGIPDPEQRFEEYPHQLSGGMRQRVMIAMSLACRPGLLIADEPTTAVDVTIQAQILDLMKELQSEFGAAILLITHDMGVVAENAHRVAVMYAGKIVETANRDMLFQYPAHPYTVKLLQSLPSGQKRDKALQTIEGRVPQATQYPSGCRFAQRCHKAMSICRQDEPTLLELEDEHKVACVLYDEDIMGRRVNPAEISENPVERPHILQQTDTDTLIQVQDLKVYFPIKKGLFKRTVGHVKAVDGLDLNIKGGKTIGLVGESGCGKTTLGRAILQLIKPTSGSVWYQQTDLVRLSRASLKPFRQKLQVVFQDPFSSLNPRMMVSEIIAEGMRVHGIGSNRKDRLKLIAELLPQVGLDPDMVHRYPHEFSGGQRQRVGIARCLAVNPEFIVCDEATSALDVSVQAQIINLLESLQAELNLTYLFITHDLSVVEYIADEIAVMYLGRIVEFGKTEEIFKDPKHPYTKALLSAVPQVDPNTGKKKIHLTGDIPSPINPPSGCHFHPRCPEVMERCSEEYATSFSFSETHFAKCWLYLKMGIVEKSG